MFQPSSLKNLVLLDRPYSEVKDLCGDERFYSLCDENTWALKAEKDLGVPVEFFELANRPLLGANPLPSRELPGSQRYLELLTSTSIVPESRANFNKRTQVVGGIYESYAGLLESIKRGSVSGVRFFFPLISDAARKDLKGKILSRRLYPYRYKIQAFLLTLVLLLGEEEAMQIARNPIFFLLTEYFPGSYFGNTEIRFPPSRVDFLVENRNFRALRRSVREEERLERWKGLIYLVRLGVVEAALICLEIINDDFEADYAEKIHKELIVSSVASGNIEIINMFVPFWSSFGFSLPLGDITDIRQIAQLPVDSFHEPEYTDNILRLIKLSFYACSQELINIFLPLAPASNSRHHSDWGNSLLQGANFFKRFVEAYPILENLIGTYGVRVVFASHVGLTTQNVDIVRRIHSLSYIEAIVMRELMICAGNVSLLVNLFMILRENNPGKPRESLLNFIRQLSSNYSGLYPLSEKICQIEYERFSQ